MNKPQEKVQPKPKVSKLNVTARLSKKFSERLLFNDVECSDNDEEDKVKFGDLLKPMISPKGKFIGFTLRTELIKPLFLADGKKLNSLRKIIQTCVYLNRIV